MKKVSFVLLFPHDRLLSFIKLHPNPSLLHPSTQLWVLRAMKLELSETYTLTFSAIKYSLQNFTRRALVLTRCIPNKAKMILLRDSLWVIAAFLVSTPSISNNSDFLRMITQVTKVFPAIIHTKLPGAATSSKLFDLAAFPHHAKDNSTQTVQCPKPRAEPPNQQQ